MDLKGSPQYDFGWTCIHVTPERGPGAMCRSAIGTGICPNCLAPVDDHRGVGTATISCVPKPRPKMNSLEWWLAQNNVEGVACLLPTFEHVMEGVHLVYALGNDGMIAQATIRTEDSERDRANSEVVHLVYLGRQLRAARMAEAAGKPVR